MFAEVNKALDLYRQTLTLKETLDDVQRRIDEIAE